MNPIKLPKIIDMSFGELVELEYLQQVFNISRRTAILYLKALHINPMYFGKDIYFSLPTFKRILFVLSKPGSKGFVFPGSRGKNRPHINNNPNYLTEVTPEILAQAAAPSILSEMMGASGKDVGILKKFVSNPVGRPPQKKENIE